MKTVILLLTFITMVTGTRNDVYAQASNESKKSLVAYFSRRGNNYRNGEIVDLKTGNTEVVAHKIQKLTGADIFYIETIKTYPVDYHETTRVAQEEQNTNARPAIKGKVGNMGDYDVIYLGYPNWWGTMPMAVFTFLDSYDFSGKTIIPFCTHEGSAMGRSEKDIKELCPKADIKEGLAIRGGNADNSDKIIENWIKAYK